MNGFQRDHENPGGQIYNVVKKKRLSLTDAAGKIKMYCFSKSTHSGCNCLEEISLMVHTLLMVIVHRWAGGELFAVLLLSGLGGFLTYV